MEEEKDHIRVPTTCTNLFSSSSSSSSISNFDPTATKRPGQTAVASTYRTKILGRSRHVTLTWRRGNVLHRCLTVSISDGRDQSNHHHRTADNNNNNNSIKIELKPWGLINKRHGSKKLTLTLDGSSNVVEVWWDLRVVKFRKGETEPSSGYYIAIVSGGGDMVFLLGDMNEEAFRRTGYRGPRVAIEPSLVSKRDHVYGKRRFSTRAKFDGNNNKVHEIAIVSCGASNSEPEMEIRLNGKVVVHVKHLQWKFRGNELVNADGLRLEVFWDVHDWLFSPGLRHALFIFKPVSNSNSNSASSLSSSSSSSTPLSSDSGSFEGFGSGGSSEFCLFLYAWKVE